MTATRTYPATASGSSGAVAPRFAPRPRPADDDDLWQGAPAPAPVPGRTPKGGPRHLRLVDPVEARRRRVTRILTGMLVAAVCAGLFSIVVLRVVLAQGQVQIDRLQASVDAQTATQQRLNLQVAQLEAPAQIVAAARSRLGMVTPPSVTYLNPAPPAPAR
ncbi:MAG TPA: septum formation initiator family protein [Acidimicrobiales bacterium]|jgi:cell division protein FtsL|nr:septum formation initiator family protein [Acidimicrobiales bacterium]